MKKLIALGGTICVIVIVLFLALHFLTPLTLTTKITICLGVATIFGVATNVYVAVQQRPERRIRIYKAHVLLNFETFSFKVRCRAINLGNTPEVFESASHLAYIDGIVRFDTSLHFGVAQANSKQGVELPMVLHPNVEYDLVGHGLFFSIGGKALDVLKRVNNENPFTVRLDFRFAHTKSIRIRTNQLGPISGWNWWHGFKESRLPET